MKKLTLLICFFTILCFPLIAYAPTGGMPTGSGGLPTGRARPQVEEVDTDPSGYFWKHIFPNLSLTDNTDGTVSIDFVAPLAGTYLKLDCSNHPLTSDLMIEQDTPWYGGFDSDTDDGWIWHINTDIASEPWRGLTLRRVDGTATNPTVTDILMHFDLNNNVSFPTGTISGGFTAGSVIFSDGTNLAEDNANLYWDNVNKRLGIGTASPSDELEVVGATARIKLSSTQDSGYHDSIFQANSITSTRSAGMLMSNDGNNKKFFAGVPYNSNLDWGVFYVNSATETDIYQAAANLLTVQDDGNVGIGTVSPAAKLHITDTAEDYITTIWETTAAGFPKEFRWWINSGRLLLRDETNGAYRFAVADNGNIGIGTTTPNADILTDPTTLELDGIGGAEIVLDHTDAGTTSTIGVLTFSRADDPLAHIKGAADGAIDSAYLAFTTQATGGSLTEQMRITSTGNVGIGTTSPDSAFHIKADFPGTIIGSDYAGQLIIQNPADTVWSNAIITGYESDGDGNPDQQLWYLGSSSVGNSNITFLNRRNSLLTLGTNNTTRMTILGGGNVGIGVTDPDTKLEVFHAGDQAKFSYNATDFTRLATDDDGNFRIIPSLQYIVIGEGGDVDYGWYFYGNTSQGLIEWNEDLGYFQISGDDATNFTKVEADGTLEFQGTATVFDDLRTPVNAVRVPSEKAPTWTAYNGTQLLGFSYQAVEGNEEEIYFTIQLTHGYKEGSDVVPHIHWVPNEDTTDDPEVVRWGLEYEWQNIGGTFAGSTTIYAEESMTDESDDHIKTLFSAIDGTGKTISSMITCRLFRNSSHINDTYDNGTALALFMEIDFHFEKDTVGSRLINDSK